MRSVCLIYTDCGRVFLELPVSGTWEFPGTETMARTRDRDMVAKLLDTGYQRFRDIRFERFLEPSLALYSCWITDEFQPNSRGVSYGWFPELPQNLAPELETHRMVITRLFAAIKESL